MARSDQGIVTPEAVLLEFESAALGSRLLGILLDFFIQANLLIPVGLLVSAIDAGPFPEWVGVVTLVIALFLVVFGYPIAQETLWNGRTVGKAAMGLRVVTREGSPVRFRHAAIRGALQLVDFFLFFGSVAAISSLLARDGQRLGDLAAGTIVVRERKAQHRARSVTFPVPAGWESYATTLDVTSVTTAQYGLVRDFLLRVGELNRDARDHLGHRIARPLAAAMHHHPVPGTSVEGFLVCTASQYQGRHVGPAMPAPPGADAAFWSERPLPDPTTDPALAPTGPVEDRPQPAREAPPDRPPPPTGPFAPPD